MKKSKLASLIFMLAVGNAAASDLEFQIGEGKIRFGGHLNGGVHTESGDYIHWENIYARQEAKRYMESVLGRFSATEQEKALAIARYEQVQEIRPYWESRDKTVSDTYARLNIAVSHKIDENLEAFAFFERDFYVADQEDYMRDGYVGVRGDWGSFRFGRDESAMRHVRELLYSLQERVGHSYQDLIEPLSVRGRKDNSAIYSFERSDFAVELGYVIKDEIDYKSEYSYSGSFKYVLAEQFVLASGYAVGKIKADKEGVIIRPDLTYYGFSSFDVDRVFDDVLYNQAYSVEQKQFNLGVSYIGTYFNAGVTFFQSENDLEVYGENQTYNSVSGVSSFKIKGLQASINKQFTEKFSAAVVYSTAENEANDFNVTDSVIVEAIYNPSKQFSFYLNYGLNNSDASDSYFLNSGIRYFL